MGPFVATIVRLIVPLFILRWPLGGLIAAVVADTLDVVIIAAIRSGMFDDYTSTDKLLDTYMLVFAALVSWRWENRIARFASIALFGYRVVGVAILQLTDARWVLFVFPSVFDFFYVYHLVTTRWFPALEVKGYRMLAYVLLILSGMKLVQEFILHIVEFRPLCWINWHISELVRTGPGSVVVNVWMRSKEYVLLLGSRIWEIEREFVLGIVTHAPDLDFQSTVTANRDSPVMRLTEFVVESVPKVSEYESQCIRFR